MGVTMKGGTSGNRESALPNVSVAFDRQVPQNTANNSGVGPGVNIEPGDDNRHLPPQHPPVPQGGTPDDAAV